MSVVLIRQHDENIYDITKKPPEQHKPSPRYVSKFDKLVRKEQEFKKEGKRYATMGPAEYPPPDAKDFLKKRTYKPPIRKPAEIEKARPAGTTPVPRTLEAVKEYEEKLKERTKKQNFIVKNIKYVLQLKPKEPEKKLVLDCHGESKDIKRGLEPQHLHSAVYGKTPKYLRRFVKMREQDVQLEKDIMGTEKPECRYITKEEREELLAGLKYNWEELQKRYQGLPILTDTVPKIQRKLKIETDLRQLERDIVLLEKHPYIYVYDDDDELN